MRIVGVYLITNLTNNKKYVGSSFNIHKRLLDHQSALRTGKHPNKHLQSSYIKYGSNSFKFEMLQEAPANISYTDLDKIEQSFIISLKCEYNKRPVSNTNRGCRHTEEARRKISLSHIGFKHKSSSKELMSKAARGRFISNKQKLDISATLKSKYKSGELKSSVIKETVLIDTLTNQSYKFNTRSKAAIFAECSIGTLSRAITKGFIIKKRYKCNN